ncbi:TlpA family protein disulfide reductase [Aurantibacillus circumpalustris]|uniref:TlpA family protein disulfide reductase n=1 Tax=Aurantibacillus circumpalustris TaxID=3036359 RepID=UPI00295BF73C|nr:hypothetical protein [Aurantibacillus circumpalustris]
MKKIVILICTILTISVSAQKGKIFPEVKGVTLNEKACALPAKNGKYSVVAIAFHRGAEDDLKKWLNPLYDNFMSKEKPGNFDMSEPVDVNFVFVPMISGFKMIKEDFQKGTDKAFWPFIMDTEKTDIKGVQKQLGIEDNKIPYFFVLDKTGKIVEMQSGKFSESKMEKLQDAIE